ncbi:MAG TPA: hypothetical protein VJ753_08030 [Rhizomicrobium sp.]|nr:hypothetical protein [Rhizomicrobium sp.]
MRFAVLAILLAMLAGTANSQPLPTPKGVPAVDGILVAFKTHPIVFMENNEGRDGHDLAQQHDFYAALVRDPRFAAEVGNVVVEVGNALHQGVIDRYVNGEDVPYTELRKVWTDTVGWVPPPFNLGYVNFFAQVRAANLSLPKARRIHVWLGEPPLDWSKVKARGDALFNSFETQRDSYPAGLINREILTKSRKALVIYGGFHVLTDPIMLGRYYQGRPTMGMLIEQQHPGAIFRVFTHAGGFENTACTLEREKNMAGLAVPALFTPLRGTSLDDPAFRQRCPMANITPSAPMPEKTRAELRASLGLYRAGASADAILYLGPVASLTASPFLPDIYLDTAYQKEVMRRMPQNTTASELGITVDKNPAAPGAFKY